MEFAMYVVNLDDGMVTGTNDVETAEQFIEDDSYVIILVQHGVWYLGSRKENPVTELANPNAAPEHDDGEDE